MGYEIQWEKPDGVIKRHFGQVTGRELLTAVTKTEADRRFDTLRYVINDFLGCTSFNVSPSELEEIAAIDQAAASTNSGIHIAIVATLPEVVSAANAYMNDPLSAYPTRVFSSMAEARAWLGLAPA